MRPRSLTLETLEPRQLLSLTPLGDELRLNATTANIQQLWQDSGAEVAVRPDGSFSAAWSSMGQDGASWGAVGRQFDAAGAPLGGEFAVNQTTANAQNRSSVAYDAAGNLVVVWQSGQQDGAAAGIFARRFGAAGQPLGNEFQVNVTTAGEQEYPTVSYLTDGRFAVAWSGNGAGDSCGVYTRIFAADGTPATGEIRVNTYTANEQKFPAVAALPNGGLLVSWVSHGGQDGSGSGVFAQRLDAFGEKVGAEFRVNTTTQSNQLAPAVAVRGDGVATIVWQSNLQDGSAAGICGQLYQADGQPLGGEFQVNTYTTNNQVYPSVAFGPRGGFLVVFCGCGPADGDGVFAREFDAQGQPVGSQFMVNQTTGGSQEFATVAGGFMGYVVGWSGAGPGDSTGVFARVYRPVNTAPTTAGIAAVNVAEDAPPTLIDLRAAFADAEDADEMLTFAVVANSNPRLFSLVAVDPATGVLLLGYAPNAFGAAIITVRATDPYGLSADATFNVNVAAVNDAPTVRTLPVVQVAEDARPTLLPLAGVFGDVDDLPGRLTFTVVGNTNPALFASPPMISPRGELILPYAPNAAGSAAVTVRATDPAACSPMLQLRCRWRLSTISRPPPRPRPSAFGETPPRRRWT